MAAAVSSGVKSPSGPTNRMAAVVPGWAWRISRSGRAPGASEAMSFRPGAVVLSGEPAVERQRVGDVGQTVLAALFAGFEGVAAPFFGLAVAWLDDGVAGDERIDPGNAELDGFLDDEVHVFPLRDGLGQGDGGQWGCGCLGGTESQGNVVAGDGEHLGRGAAAEAIEDGDGLAGLDAQDLGEVAGLVSGEGGTRIPSSRVAGGSGASVMETEDV